MLTTKQLAALKRAPLTSRNKLDTAMKLAGVTQLQIEAATGIPQSYISKIKRGTYSDSGLPLETPRKLAAFFHCAIEDLFPAQEAIAS